ncbi:MAG: hypothetical protein JXR19_01770 [Bacteroidia bacterium]
MNKRIEVKVDSGPNNLIWSKHFVTSHEGRTLFQIENDEQDLQLIFEFISDNVNKETRESGEDINEQTALIKFTNYHEPRHTTAPWEIGSIYNRKLLMTYMIAPLYDSSLFSVTVSLYLGEEVKDGEL